MGRQGRRNALVEIEFPVHALGNRLDHQVALSQPIQVIFIVGGRDAYGILRHTQRSRLDLLEVVDRLLHDAVLGPFFGRQVKQHHGHIHIDQMRRNLRPHHPGAENGDLANLKSFHDHSNLSHF